MQGSAILASIVDEISVKNPMHGKKLLSSLSNMDDSYYREADAFFSNYKKFALSQGKDMQYGIDAYLWMIAGMMDEYLHFARTGEYSCKSFEDAEKRVYSDAAVMEPYMHGLLLSQLLWRHHYDIYEFFSRGIAEYAANTETYLEIGGGHGLYLSQAIGALSDDSSFAMVDISESSLEMARSFISNDIVDYIQSDIYDYTPKSRYDFISMGEVLEHVEQPKKLLSALSNLLTQDGVLFITTPTNAPAIDHIYLFRDEQEIVDLIVECGFRIKSSIAAYSEDVSREVAERKKITMMYGAFLELDNK